MPSAQHYKDIGVEIQNLLKRDGVANLRKTMSTNIAASSNCDAAALENVPVFRLVVLYSIGCNYRKRPTSLAFGCVNSGQ